jgi:VCBS repeat-containing protein
MKQAHWVILPIVIAFVACQQLPTEPTPIDLSEEMPVAVPDTASVDEDLAVSIDVLKNDSSLVGDALKTTGIAGEPTQGTATIESDRIRYEPVSNFSGIDSLRYVVSGSVLSNSASVYIVVLPVNDPPVANNDDFRVVETASAAKVQADLQVLDNDTDIDGDKLTVLQATEPTNGQTEIPEGGLSVIYTPNVDFVGADAFRYTIQDGNGGLAVADVTISVQPSNDEPVARDDSWAVREDETLHVTMPGVLENDSDPDFDLLEAQLRQDVSHGSLLLQTDGSFIYQPEADFTGVDEFKYIATDGASESNLSTVTITVLSVNDNPFAFADTFRVNEDAHLNVTAPGVLGNDVEPEGGTLGARLVTGVTNGTLDFEMDGSFTYVGDPNFHGADGFTYVASDGTSESPPTEVFIDVLPVNDSPSAAVDSYELNEDEPLSIDVPGVLANDSDLDGDELIASIQTLPANGIVTLQSDGAFVYSPSQDFFGLDGFTYLATDGQASSIAAVSLKVNSLNDVPTAGEDSYETPANVGLEVSAPGVLANDHDADGDRLSVEMVVETEHGAAVLNLDGSFQYIPTHSYVGEDRFTYHVSDGMVQSEPATVTINVVSVGSPPVAADDFFTVSPDSVFVVDAPGILNNDVDTDQDILTAIIVVNVAVGTLGLSDNGSFTYESPTDFTGLVTFAYRASDGENLSNVAIVHLTVQ